MHARRSVPILALVLHLLLLGAPPAWGENTTPATSAHLTVGQPPVRVPIDGTTTERWYDVQLRIGRSYCVSVTTADNETNPGDPAVTVFQSDGATQIASNDNIVTEPAALLQARACFIHPSGATTEAKIRVTHNDGAVSRTYFLRAVETTLFCPWFFIGEDYQAFSLLRNTTDASVSVTVTWRNLAGTVLATTTTTASANGTLALNARDFFGPEVSPNGSVEVAHNGSEEAIQGSTTTLSGTTGLAFDALFTQRRPW